MWGEFLGRGVGGKGPIIPLKLGKLFIVFVFCENCWGGGEGDVYLTLSFLLLSLPPPI